MIVCVGICSKLSLDQYHVCTCYARLGNDSAWCFCKQIFKSLSINPYITKTSQTLEKIVYDANTYHPGTRDFQTNNALVWDEME